LGNWDDKNVCPEHAKRILQEQTLFSQIWFIPSEVKIFILDMRYFE
jgi:hypothetical protein